MLLQFCWKSARPLCSYPIGTKTLCKLCYICNGIQCVLPGIAKSWQSSKNNFKDSILTNILLHNAENSEVWNLVILAQWFGYQSRIKSGIKWNIWPLLNGGHESKQDSSHQNMIEEPSPWLFCCPPVWIWMVEYSFQHGFKGFSSFYTSKLGIGSRWRCCGFAFYEGELTYIVLCEQ